MARWWRSPRGSPCWWASPSASSRRFNGLACALVRVLNEGERPARRVASGFCAPTAHLLRSPSHRWRWRWCCWWAQGLLLRSFVTFVTLDRGYDPANVITARTRNPDIRITPGMMTPGGAERHRGRQSPLPRRAPRRADSRPPALPTTVAVGLSSSVPLAGGGASQMPVRVAGRPPPDESAGVPRR